MISQQDIQRALDWFAASSRQFRRDGYIQLADDIERDVERIGVTIQKSPVPVQSPKPASFHEALDAHVVACNRFEAAQRELEDARKAVETARDAVREAV